METGNFKLELKQNDEIIYTSIFDNTHYSPKTLSSIDVRNVLTNVFKDLSYISSRNDYTFTYNNIDLLKHYKQNFGHLRSSDDKLKKPKIRKLEIKNRLIKGVEVGLVFYINDKIIFDRTVYVDNYNPEFRFSNEIKETMDSIKDVFLDEIKKHDSLNIFNENREYLNV